MRFLTCQFLFCHLLPIIKADVILVSLVSALAATVLEELQQRVVGYSVSELVKFLVDEESEDDPTKDIIDQIVGLSSVIDQTSGAILNEIAKSRTAVVQELYKNDLSQYLNYVTHEYEVAFNFIYKNKLESTETYALAWAKYDGPLRNKLISINSVMENYLKMTAAAVKENQPICDVKNLGQKSFMDEIMNIALVFLKGYEIIETSMLYLGETGYYANNTLLRENLDRNFFDLWTSFQLLSKHGMGNMKKLIDAIWKCDSPNMDKAGFVTDVRVFQKIVYFKSCLKDQEKDFCLLLRQQAQCNPTEINAQCSQKIRSSVKYCYARNPYSQGHFNTFNYIKWYGEDGEKINFEHSANCETDSVSNTLTSLLKDPIFYAQNGLKIESVLCDCQKPPYVKKICLGQYYARNLDNVITGVQIVNVNNTLFLRIQDGYMTDKNIIQENTVGWKFMDTNCPPLQQYEIKENSSIVLGDIFVPGQVIVGIELEAKETDKLSLGLLTRPSKHVFNEDLKLYEEHYKAELETLRQTQVIEPLNQGFFTNHRIFKSNFREDYIKTRQPLINGDAPAFMSKKNATLLPVEPGTQLFFKKSNFTKDLSQRLVPALDMQPIELRPHVSHSGAGFMFKRGDEDSGGYVALKLLAHDLSEDVNDLFSEKLLKKQKIVV